MTANGSNPQVQPQPATAIPLSYGYYQPPRRPGIVTAAAVIGIILSALGGLSTLAGLLYAVLYGGAAWSAAASDVSLCEAFCGGLLAIALLIGSIGLLRLSRWSRKLLLWWACIYIVSAVVFMMLQILVIVPAQMAMFNGIMTAASSAAAPATAPASAAASSSGTSSSTVVAYSFSSSVTAPGGMNTVVAATGPAAAAVPFQGAAGTAMMSMMERFYDALAVGKMLVYLIFPIAMLVVLTRPRVRAALSGQNV